VDATPEPMTPWPEPELEPELERTLRSARPRGGDGFAAAYAAQRLVQDRFAGAALPPGVAAAVTRRLQELADLLGEHQVPEADRHDGWRPDLPGRGLPMMPPYVLDEEGAASLRGRVTFTRFYLGGNGAAHGGAHPMLFDDVLGRVMNHHQPGVARTVSLTVNYRRITPLDVELSFEATRDRVDGRKRWGSARLFDPSGAVVADCDAFFLQLLPGQA
jgi:acyl-coenzyme A thioesterase PaaI-like protein